ncbi:hypothetical protein PTKIN_Ptkin19aG0013800 [Pterospermum kingtungense]
MQMEVSKASAVTPSKSKWVITLSKVVHLRAAVAGIVPADDGVHKLKPQETESKTIKRLSQKFNRLNDHEELETKLALEALIAKIFATISGIKVGYAQLQQSESPYDAAGIQATDQFIVSEFKKLSELKQCFWKKQYDPSPERAMVFADIQEHRSLSKTFEIMGKNFESHLRLKESEIVFLQEKLDESNKQSRLVEKRLNQSNNLHVSSSGLSPSYFITVLQQTVKSITSFVKLMIDEMQSAKWDINAAASSIAPGVFFGKADDRCFASESFICGRIFNAFHRPYFALLGQGKKHSKVLFERFMELKSMEVKQYLAMKPKSTIGKFCRKKYLQIVHPKMESSFFGNLSIRDMVSCYQFPDTSFFSIFAEMEKRVWLMHCLAFAFEPEASIFEIIKGCRFSQVHMDNVAEEAFLAPIQSEPRVAFTVVPGFRIGKTVIQCKVYLSQLKTR